MEQNLEVFFCDLCNTSVPQRDLETADAVRVNDKVVGRCCLATLRKATGAPAAAGSTGAGGGVVVGIVLLAAIAGATVFLDWRFGEENTRLAGTITSVQGDLGKQSERLARVERLAADAAGRGDVDRLLGAFERERGSRDEAASAALDKVLAAAEKKADKLAEAVGETGEQLRKSHAALQGELRSLAADVAALKAAPRTEPQAPPAEAAMPAQPPDTTPAPAPPADGLPPELAHHVARLGDADAAIRFEAVDKLVQSKNPAVLPSLLKMTKDVDDFVRRLTVEGLGGFRHPDTVDALLVALADPINIVRMTAYNSLKAITGQKIPFDPEGTQTDRLASQRRWQEWWKNARKSF